MKLLIRLFINAIAIFVIALYMPGFRVSGFVAAFVFAVILGIVNAIIRPVVMIFTLPINILTIGLFTFVINAALFWITSQFIPGVQIDTFAAAFWGALTLSMVSFFTSFLK